MKNTMARRDIINDDAPRRSRFMIACIAAMLIASGLVCIQVPAQSWKAVFQTMSDYGLGIIAVLAALLCLHFTILLIVHIFSANFAKQHPGVVGTQPNSLSWCKAYFAFPRWIEILVATSTLTVTNACFTVYKATVVGANGYGFDATFIAWDRVLFGGA